MRLTLHRRKTRGGQLIALDQIDGATMRRVLDDWGRTPEDPKDTAYQQILKGMPALNYRKSDEILYRPRNLRIHKIYGYSQVEQIMMTINIGLRRQVFQLNFFTEGNMPPALIGVPEQWTPDQIRTFQEWFDNILAGNLAERRRARFVPSAVGKTYIPTQETELFGKAEEWLARVCCFAFSPFASAFS
jgi:phage portal protein BeeE